MKKMNIYAFIWGIILLAVIVLLTFFGFIYKDKTKGYKQLEEKIIEAEKKYVDANFLYPQDNQLLKTSINELSENEYLDTTELKENSCEGYVEVKKDGTIYNYKAFIKCDNYITKGYEE